MTMLPERLIDPLREHLERVRALHEADVAAGAGWVMLPDALDRKFPNAGRECPWQWVFPATRTYVDPESGRVRRHHLHESVLQRAVKEAVVARGPSGGRWEEGPAIDGGKGDEEERRTASRRRGR